MVAKTFNRGHEIIVVDNKGYYSDDFEIAFIREGYEHLWNERPCKRCGHYPSGKGHDYCIQDLPDVEFACCGHQIGNSYIKFKNGLVIRGWTSIERGDLDE